MVRLSEVWIGLMLRGLVGLSDSMTYLASTFLVRNFLVAPIELLKCGLLSSRFEEYPKLRELIKLKNDLVADTAHPPMYLKCDLETFDLKSLDSQFDVILIEPPLEESARSHGVTNVKFWDWDRIMALDISELAAQRSFIFLWYGLDCSLVTIFCQGYNLHV